MTLSCPMWHSDWEFLWRKPEELGLGSWQMWNSCPDRFFKAWVWSLLALLRPPATWAGAAQKSASRGAGRKRDSDKYPLDLTQIPEGLGLTFLFKSILLQPLLDRLLVQMSFSTLRTSKRKIYLSHYLRHNCWQLLCSQTVTQFLSRGDGFLFSTIQFN